MQKFFTLGVEEEFQIVDPSTRDLKPFVEQMLSHGEEDFIEHVKREMIQSMVETVTPVCENVEAARREVYRLRAGVAELAARNGLAIVASGAHPFSHWQSQIITENERYKVLEQDLQDVVRSILIFGLHVHVGIPDRDLLVDIMNEARYFLPHMLALSSNSPFWQGRHTGLKSYRTIIWQQFPRTGIPSTLGSWSDFENFVNLLIKTNSIDNGKKIWWDLRPHPYFSTLEFRVCDMPTNPAETIMIVAFFQAIVAKLYKLRQKNLGFRIYDRALIMENKWRAARYGIDGMLIDFGKEQEVPMRQLALELLEFVDDVVDDLGSRDAVNYVHKVLQDGTGADRQMEIYRRTGNLSDVVDYLIYETMNGIEWQGYPR
ncbi:MAG: carboxylate-amine ligase [Chloroflexota bacterium]|nr:carboxylate-amine ligase [Chloroflexota bacterium]MDQ5866702.1 carboxylate-amine ligase [Chloroflexota bacterium]